VALEPQTNLCRIILTAVGQDSGWIPIEVFRAWGRFAKMRVKTSSRDQELSV